jgi:ketosteroid isomerase-like protein
MTPCDPMAVAVDWLDAYRDATLDQIIAMYSPDGVIECACGGGKIIRGAAGIPAYWRHRFLQIPALELEELQMDGGSVVVCYRTSSGIVQALLHVADDGLITHCRCGPVTRDLPTCREE